MFQFDLGDTVVFQLCVYLYAFFFGRLIREFLILSWVDRGPLFAVLVYNSAVYILVSVLRYVLNFVCYNLDLFTF